MICNANPRKKKHKAKTTKKNGHKKQNDGAQGPCQKDLIRLSIFHPKHFLDATPALELLFTLEW